MLWLAVVGMPHQLQQCSQRVLTICFKLLRVLAVAGDGEKGAGEGGSLAEVQSEEEGEVSEVMQAHIQGPAGDEVPDAVSAGEAGAAAQRKDTRFGFLFLKEQV